MKIQRVAMLVLAVAGCSKQGGNLGLEGGSVVLTPVALDDSSAMGFSANDVLDHFGAEREYQVELFDGGAAMDSDDQLYDNGYAPFTVAVDATTAVAEHGQSLLGDGTIVGESLLLTVTVTTTSAAGDIDVTGPAYLGATALSDDQIGWGVDTLTGEVLIQTGTFPTWVPEQAEALVGQSQCAARASDPSAVALYQVAAFLTGAIEQPMLRVGLYWDPAEESGCQQFEALDMVWLVP